MLFSMQPAQFHRPIFLDPSTHFPSLKTQFFLITKPIHRHRFLVFASAIKEKNNSYAHTSSMKIQSQDVLQTTAKNPQDFERFDVKTITQFNDVLLSSVADGDFEAVLKLKSNLSSFGIVPNTRTYSILVDFHCKKNDPFDAKSVLDDMLDSGFKPNAATFTTLINCFCKNGRMRDAFEVFDVMSKTECEPTINTYNCLLKGLCYVGRVEEAYDLLMSIKESSMKPDIYTYTAVMDGFCKVGRSNEALELLDEAVEVGLTPNVVTYNTLFNGYFKEGRPLSGIGLLRHMQEENCEPDCVSYSTLLHGLLKWGEFREALKIYREMVEVGLRVDERMMNTLLRGLCRHSRKERELLEDVYDVFEQMNEGNFTVYARGYDLVVEALIHGKETNKAFVVLNEMMNIGFSPTTFVFNIVMQELCFIGEADKALAVLMLMHKDRKSSGIPFSLLIDELKRQGRLLEACHVYGMALKRGVLPRSKPGKQIAEADIRLVQ